MDILDISKKEFSKSVLGYDCKEVDTFLDAVMDRMTEYEKEKKEILTALEYLLKELEGYEKVKNSSKKKVSIEERNEEVDEGSQDDLKSENQNISDMLKQIEASIEKEIHFSE